MKRIYLTSILIIAFIFTTHAQKGIFNFGFKGGLNYNANGDYVNSITENAEHPDGNAGFHVGMFGKIELVGLYIRPELVYTQTKSDYENNSFTMKKLDLPVLVGVTVFGPLKLFAGPSFQYILDTDFGNITIDDVENNFTVGFNFGLGVNFKKIGIDLRYERGFSKNEAKLIDIVSDADIGKIDTRPNQLILSFSFLL